MTVETRYKLLVQPQLSNYDSRGTFILEADSGWNMCVGRIREMLKLNSGLHVDILGPCLGQLRTAHYDVNPDLFGSGRVRYIENWIVPNALATRYDFDFDSIGRVLELAQHKVNTFGRYDAIYINDPMHLRSFRALFHVVGGYTPKFYVHSHFIDDPQSPKFPTEASLWLGQCEAALRADYNFWQCQSSLDTFEREMRKLYRDHVVDEVMLRSAPWDDGYSIAEITQPIREENLRFDTKDALRRFSGHVVVFVPNRIGGRGRSSDYTNCGRFMFDLLPQLRQRRQDFIVVAGNPSQKFMNYEVEDLCGKHGYVNLVPDALNRDEYRWVARHSDIAVGLYDCDTYGGTAARECIELGCVPLWIDKFEYSSIAREANWPYLANPNFGLEFMLMADALIETVKSRKHRGWLTQLQDAIRKKCSYEATTRRAMVKMGLL